MKIALPEFKTNAGNRLLIPSLSGGDIRFYVQNTTEDECRDYADALVVSGFIKYSENNISAGAECPYNTNIAYTFISEESFVFIFWDASLRTVFVVQTPPTDLPALNAPLFESLEGVKPSITQLSLKGGGLCDIITLADGSFIIIDSGVRCDVDEENLYNFLVSNTPCGAKPRIALWFITHPHADHVEMALVFMQKRRDFVTVEAFAHQFPDCAPEIIPHDGEVGIALGKQFLKVANECFPNAKRYYLHTGQVFYFAGATLEILSSMDNNFPGLYFSCNDISVVSRLSFDSGKTVMLLADATQHVTRAIAHTYGSYLKSDVLQVAHHGLIGGNLGLYKLIDPNICLWPVKEPRFNGTLEGQKYQYCIGEGGLDFNSWLRDDSVKSRKHYSFDTDATVFA